jgi:hypothetical protein
LFKEGDENGSKKEKSKKEEISNSKILAEIFTLF